MTEAEQVMKRCQIGTRDYNEANNLHADCYRVIGKLLAQRTEQEPVRAPWSQALESVWAEQEPVAWAEQEPVAWAEQEPVAWAEQEPVALVAEVHMSRYTIEWTNGPLPEGTKLYTAPPQRKPLTQDGTMEIANQTAGQYWMDEAHIQRFRAAVEAAHGIKENT